MTKRYAEGRVPRPGTAEEPEQRVRKAAEVAVAGLQRHMPRTELHRALESVFHLADEANRYLEEREPWKAAKDPALEQRVRTTLYTCCEALRILSILLSPFLPEKSSEIATRLGLGDAHGRASLAEGTRWGGIPVGVETSKGAPLFPRIETAPGAE
jgi:methionyl-tRNA synthetase